MGKPAIPGKSPLRSQLQAQYDQLWSAAAGRIRTGNIEIDPVLAAGKPDRRRGLTLAARPSATVQRRVEAFLDLLRKCEPAQYYYAPSEFHVTVLSLFTATVNHRRFFAHSKGYVAAVDALLREARPVRLEFRGVTASAGALLIQGFFDTDALNQLRDALRARLRDDGLAEGVDRRYRLATAHMTVARFRAPLRDPEKFFALLDRAREKPFGTANIREVSLVKNDWYMSHRRLETVKRYFFTNRASDAV